MNVENNILYYNYNKMFIKEKIKQLKEKYKSERFCIWGWSRKVQNWFIIFVWSDKRLKEIEYSGIYELKAIIELLEKSWYKIIKIEVIFKNQLLHEKRITDVDEEYIY